MKTIFIVLVYNNNTVGENDNFFTHILNSLLFYKKVTQYTLYRTSEWNINAMAQKVGLTWKDLFITVIAVILLNSYSNGSKQA